MEAERAASEHVQSEHGPMFKYLLNLDKKLTGLTDTQKELMTMFYSGLNDKEISERQGGSSSTIRHHRYKLREKEKQARIFLALMGLLSPKDEFIPIHKGATMVDDRYAITAQERDKIITNYIRDGKLTEFPKKQKRKLVILKYLSERLEPNREYTEREVNAILNDFYEDYVTLRRYLIEYGFLNRDRDGSRYWVNI